MHAPEVRWREVKGERPKQRGLSCWGLSKETTFRELFKKKEKMAMEERHRHRGKP